MLSASLHILVLVLSHVLCAQSLSHFWLFCDYMVYSPQGSSVHGIFQARILEYIAISYFRGSSCPRDRTRVSCIGRFSTEPSGKLIVLHIMKTLIPVLGKYKDSPNLIRPPGLSGTSSSYLMNHNLNQCINAWKWLE